MRETNKKRKGKISKAKNFDSSICFAHGRFVIIYVLCIANPILPCQKRTCGCFFHKEKGRTLSLSSSAYDIDSDYGRSLVSSSSTSSFMNFSLFLNM